LRGESEQRPSIEVVGREIGAEGVEIVHSLPQYAIVGLVEIGSVDGGALEMKVDEIRERAEDDEPDGVRVEFHGILP
jgi:uncharacterized protein with ACT and thioredoxin-like domain